MLKTGKQFPDPPAHLHLIGLKGVAMTALAEILQGQGYVISGSDTSEVFTTDSVLKRLNIHCANGFEAGNIGPRVAAVIYSTAYADDHIERRAVQVRGISEWSYPEVVGFLLAMYAHSIAVAGSHGKTTTTAMLARMLEEGGLDPTAIVGSTVMDWGGNARLGSSPWFVLEADEYQNKFQYYAPRHLIITNVDYDHPDYFPDIKSYQTVFLDFDAKIPTDGTLIAWGEEPLRLKLQSVCRGKFLTYGTAKNNDWRLTDVVLAENTSFKVIHNGNPYGEFNIPTTGFHYALNALGAIAMADAAGVNLEAIARALINFRGTARRLEYRGEFNKAIIIDDYAHHPTEITATIAALRARYPQRRLWCVFQAHTFSRTAAFLKNFAAALNHADQIILPPIYSSAREKGGEVDNNIIAEAVKQLTASRARPVRTLEEAADILRGVLKEGDVVVTMGAGDIWRLAEMIMS